LLDQYFNNEWKKDANGKNVRWHYTWDDKANSGFSMLGDVFRNHGAQTKSLDVAPSAQNLKGASVYIIVDPDTDKETEKPNTITEANASVIAEWVKGGGVLVLLGNDAGNADLKGLNVLSSKFGVRFNEDNFNLVQGNLFEQGAVMVPAQSAVFKTAGKLYIKELATLQVTKPATTIVSKEGKNVMAVASYGKGTVFFLGDPWLYNEYTDGRKLPADFDNYKAADDLVKWLLSQSRKK
jgi:unsaturated rhamnogalacturonyl hydrolase